MADHVDKEENIDDIQTIKTPTDQVYTEIMDRMEDIRYTYPCSHCKKNLPGDDNLLCVHIGQCHVPCDGDPHCPCK